MSFTIIPVTDTPETALYVQYSGQTQPQGVFLEITPNAATIDYDGEIGSAVPEAVYHHRTLRFYFNTGVPTVSAANDFLNDNIECIAEIAAGMGEHWDGNNMVGTLTDEADMAVQRLDLIIDADPYDTVEHWDAGDWLQDWNNPQLTANTTDDELADMAASLQGELEPWQLVDGIYEELVNRRQQLRDAED